MDELYPCDLSLAEIVEAQAARAPFAPAVVFGGECLGYDALNRRANRLARHLRAAGVGPGGRVATFLERSADMVAAWLAILKVGAAYVPLDPSYPRERLRFMLEDSGATMVVATSRDRLLLPDGAVVVSLDEERDAIAVRSDANLPCEATGASLAHVIYTSGSTGVPKGVCIPQRAVSRLVLDTAWFRLEPSDRMAQAANASFDATTLEVWGPLLNGACVVGVPRDVVLSPPALARFIQEQQITVMFLTTALFNAVVGVDPRAFAGMRALFTGGEAMNTRCARDVVRAGPPERFMNVYGPTENGVFSTFHPIHAVPPDAVSVPIGGPVDRTDLCVLDEGVQPVPPGAPGELCTGGDGLADGYWNRPELTASRFVPHPFGTRPGARLYRTGDRVRRLPDGAIEFLGRVDQQVKIRGHRIEPGEIDAVLVQHPAVAEAAVVAREDRPGEKRLVAYVQSAGRARLGVAELRAFAADRVPGYMVPSAFVVLDEMPLTPSGKIDRRALPPPPVTRASAREYVAPRTPVEEALAAIWASLTGVAEVGVDDDFFELGGHSLLAAQIVARINETFGTNLPLSAIFERPTVAAMAEGLAAAGRQVRPAATPLARAPRGVPLPLSYSQETVWFLNELEPGNLAYNFQASIRFTGALDVAALQRTLEEIVRRHEIFRTAFVEDGGRPAQVIHDPMPVELPIVELRHHADGERRAIVERLLRDQFKTPFALERPPLVRWTLLRTADEEHELVHVEHHIVHDGWSFALLLREMKTIYEAFSRGERSPLADPEWQFADYTCWQRESLDGGALEAQLAFWRRYLAGAPAVLDLPTDHPRPEAVSFRGGCERIDVPTDLYAAMRAFSRREKVTLFMTMAAAFQALLWRYTGEQDMVLGTAMANRPRREFESVMGMFVNPVLMRTDLSGNPTFHELVQRVRAVALDVYAYQETPIVKLVEALQPERDRSRNPLFQVLFSFHDAAVPELAFDRVIGTIVERQNGSAKFDLNIICIPRVEQRAGNSGVSEEVGLTVLWEYNADLFEHATAMRLFEEYTNVLRAATADPGLRLAELPFLSGRDRHRLLVEANATPAAAPERQTLHALVEARAERTPDAVAVGVDGEGLTYRDLNRRANQIAHRLIRDGAGPGTLVAILAEPSAEMVAASLGALKAGAACVPIDGACSDERLAEIALDASVPLLVVQEHLAWRVPAGAAVVVLDRDWTSVAAEPDRDPGAGVTPDGLACVLYTPGATGAPKGVALTHAGVARIAAGAGAELEIGEGGVWALANAAGFHLSLWEMWGALLHGGRLVPVPAVTARSPEECYALVCREGVTVITLTPTALRRLALAQSAAAETHRLRHVILGGEVVDAAAFGRWFADGRNAATRVTSVYALAEASGPVTCAALDAGAAREGRAPRGRRLSEARVYVLDAHGQPVPPGVVGELYVGGAGVARGYLNRPALDEECFLADPFCPEPGARMVRTGDSGRRLSDGTVECLGRVGPRVRIRGLTVDEGRIAARVAAQPGVADAVVVARGDAAGETQLVAYYLCEPAADVEAEALRAELARALPAYMVPAAYVRLDAFPLTPHATLDRGALPAPDFTGTEPAFVAPRTELEAQIAEIWRQVLGVERVGARDYFFDLGGHSLKTLQIRSRVSQELGVDLPLREAFDHPTVEQQAQLLASRRAAAPGAAQAAPAIPRLPDRPHYPLSHAQRRLWFLHRLDPADTYYNRSIRIGLRGPLDRAALGRAFDGLVARHETLRTQFGIVDDEPVQTIVEDFRAPIEVHDLPSSGPDRRDADLRALIVRLESAPLTLDAPPIRAYLCRLGDDHHVFGIVLHHIAFDGWSGEVLLADLASLYRAECRGAAPDLQPLPVRYVDYAAWQQEQAASGALREDEEHWLRQLSGELPRLELAPDAAADGGAEHTVHVEIAECGAAESARLEALAREHGVTTFVLRTAILQAFLARFTGQADVLIGAPAAGRAQPELERVVGFFVNTLPLRTSLAGDPTFAGALDRVRGTVLDGYVHEAYPFDLLVERLNPVRDADRMPLLQALFTVETFEFRQTVEDVTFELMSALAVDVALAGGAAGRTGKLDLSVSCLEKPDGGVAWAFLVDGRRISKASARRIAAAFETFHAAVAERPGSRLSALPVLPARDRRRVVAEWNDTDSPYRVACIHELFEAQARRTPDAVAAVCGEARLTFADLDRRANWVAHRLRAMGVGPEALVGLYVERTLDLLVALLGTWKAGGACLPLDPKYPRARLEWMLADGGASIVVTDRALADRLPALAGVQVWALDAVWRDPAAVADAPPASGVAPGDLAYVIYTSGSTGTPKGVAVEHRSVAAFVHHAGQMFTPEERAGSVAATSLCFDFWVCEILTPLAWGGTVILVESALHLASLPPAVPATMLCGVPSAVAELLRAGALPRSIRAAAIGGEPVPNRLVQQVYANGAARVFNVYGPTEATCLTTWMPVVPGDTADPPIGRPIANARTYVLDANFEPVAPGVVGELYVGGAGLVRGYHRRPDLTAERFVPSPFGPDGARLYRTGDRVRHREDGALEFVGRCDDQVKLRGYRVELGEIETALLAHGTLREAVVVVREDTPGERTLVAYVVPADARPAEAPGGAQDPAGARALQRSLHAKLPVYMVPSAIVVLDAVPRHPNGKVNRAALPAPEASVEADRVEPRTDLEREIAAIWSDVLGAGPIGIDDNVYELGAHSLMAAKVHRRLQDLLAARWAVAGLGAPAAVAARIQQQVRELVAQALPLRAVFDHPTVRTLAGSLGDTADEPTDPPGGGAAPRAGADAAVEEPSGAAAACGARDAAPATAVSADHPVSRAQRRMWLLHRLDATGGAYNIVYSLQVRGPLDAGALERALGLLAERHEALRTTIVETGGDIVQHVHPRLEIPWRVLDLAPLAKEARDAGFREALMREAREPFDLEHGPLMRAELARMSEGEHRLVLSMHHLVMDGRSWEVMFDDLCTAYAALVSGAAPSFAPAGIPYVEYTAWQNARLADGSLSAAEAYWTGRFAGGIPELALPADHPNPRARRFQRHRHSVVLERGIADRLRAIARHANATPFIVYLTIVNAFLRRMTGQDDLVVGSPVSGRDHPGADRTVGCFINTVLLRTTVAGDPTFADLVAAVRRDAIDAYQHQDYPLDLLVQKLGLGRGAERTSLVQVLFATTDTPPRSRVAGGAEIALQTAADMIDLDADAALPSKFDFHVGALDEPDGRLTWILGFDTDLFEAATARRLTRRFEAFVAGIARQPDARLSTLALLTEGEDESLRLSRAAGRTEYPPSFNQREMWAQCQLQSGSALNNIGVEVALAGPLDVESFQDAFQAVVDRHEALRTRFDAPEGTPVQRVEPVRARATEHDLSGEPAGEQESAVRARRDALAAEPFALDRAPLFRAELLRLGDGRHVFLFVVHHLVLDAYYLAQFLDELAGVYERYASGDRQPLPPAPLQYGDLAIWEERALGAGLLARHQPYWRAQLRTPLPAMTIPAHRQPPPVRTFENGYVRRRISPAVTAALKALALRQRTTLYCTVAAGYDVWLWRMTGEADLLVAMPFSTRPHELREGVGFFANTLPLRRELDVDRPFAALLAEVTDQLREARSHREFPLTEAMRSVDVARDPNRPALPVCISQVRAFSRRAGALWIESGAPFARSTWDMWLSVAEAGDGVALELTYAAELFEHAAVEAWADALVTLLSSIASSPDVPIRALPFVSPDAEARLRAIGDGGGGRWEVPEAGRPLPPSVGIQLAAVAARTPDAVAVVAGAERWSYARLQAEAGSVAAALAAGGTGREDRVGILGTRSPGMLASVVGVLQAGAAFVPLEASQPDARLQTIALAAGVTAVLADGESYARAKTLVAGITPAVRVLSWDDLGPALPPGPAPLVANAASDLAYIFYTSGSTGAPKGAMVEQRGMRNHLRAKIETLGLGPASIVAQTASYGFDIVVWQWLAPLLAGGRVVIYDDATAYDPAALVAALARDGVTVVETVPSFLEAMTAVAGAAPLPSLRWMVSNAEALPPAVAARWLARHPGTRLLNTCGATECSDDTTHGEVPAALAADLVRVSVGRPVPGSTAAVVDDMLRPVPPGCVGEIAYGGIVVGRGYLGDAVATARAFVPDPAGAVPGARMYLTGDRGRWRENGELECLGRIDDQVKVHGYRVELGEVEAALAAAPGLSQSAAAVRTDARGQHRLVAYYVAPAACDESAVRAALSARLPPYMVPSAFVRLAALPRTRTGKLDRAALPAPAAAPETSAAPEAAGTPVEAILAEVWQQVLQVPFVGRHDNFFDLGGDSIQSILVASRLTQRGLRVSPRAVFAHQTIAELARVVEQSERPCAPRDAASAPAPLLPIQQGFFDQEMADPHHWNQAVVVEPKSADERVLRQALQALADCHPALRMRFVRRDGRWLQQPAPAGEPVAFDVVDLDGSGEPLEAAATRLQASIDFERGPIFRAALLKAGGSADRLLLVVHHLVIDTVSWGVLMEDLGRACEQAAAGHRIDLLPEATTCTQWVEALASPADRFDGELPYWQSVLERTRPLPRDHDLGPNTAASLERVRVSVEPETTRRLLTGARRALQADITHLLVCAFARAAGAWTGGRDLSLFVEGHGREDLVPGVDLGRTIGWFTAAYPVCVDTRALDLAAHVTRVRDTLRQVPNHGVGYGFLRRVTRRLADARAPEVCLNYHGQVGRLIATDRFAITRESAGAWTSPRNTRAMLLDVECRVVAGRLEIDCFYSRNVHGRETIARLAEAFASELGRLSMLCDEALLPAEAEEVYPLAPIQEGMLFHALFEPDSSLYYEQARMALEGPLDVEALRGAWTHLFASHPILRTVIRWEGFQEPVQVVLAPSPAPLGVVDLRHLPPGEQDAHLARHSDEQWAERFQLDRGPLVRLTLFDLGAERFRLVWSFHHILLDGWSVATLMREVAGAYASLVARRPPTPSPARPYRDFVAWLRRQDRAAALDFWRRQLAGFQSATPLPRDRPKPAVRRREASHVGLALDPDLTRALERWTRAERVTMSAFVRTAWAVLLGRMSGTTDVVFGATVSGRPAELGGVEQMVGPFINAVPARVVLDEADTPASLVGRVHAQSVEAGAFEYLPLPELQKACGIPADRPLFETLLAYENYPEDRPATMGGVRVRNVAGRELTHYDLTLVAETTDTLRLRLSYATDVFEHATAKRIVDSLAGLLAAMAAGPRARMSEVSFMSAADAALAAGWSDGGPGIAPTDRSIAADVFDVAARTPHAVAVVSGEERWTYAQLCAAAARMGVALREAGVGREGRVAVLGTRSPRMIATVVGVTHAGGAFVPIEVNQPDARIRAIVQRARPAVIVTDRAALPRARRAIAGLTPAPAVLVWDDVAVAAGEAVTTPPAAVGPSDLAYILFTSGSTGTPKGVMVEQRGMRNHIRAKTDLVGLHAAGVLVQNSSCSFDIVVWQMLAPLLVGGRAVVYDTGTATDGPALLAALARDRVTVVELVPSVIKDLLAASEAPGAPALPALEWMVSNAEPLAAAVVARWHARYPGVRLANCYGLTECSDDITHVELFASHGSAARVPVGRPIPGSTVSVVDDRLQPVPPGCVGEIVVGGVAVARGYLDDPVATARAFVPDPASAVPGARLYRAGDRGRWRTDGLLECLGRRDDQVKVHGYRLELGEVESALAALPELSQAAAAVRPDARGEEHLVAYYVAPAPCDVAAARTALASRLPAHMVPDAFVRLDALPLTVTGKLDRGALPAPHGLETAPAAAEPPLTPLEATVAAVWQHVLQAPHVGRRDTFFELGGHSLTAIRIVAALKERLGRQVPIWQLFMTPALGDFAKAIEHAPAAAAPALTRVPDRESYPVSSAQRVQWIVAQLKGGRTWHPPRVLQLEGDLDREALGRALEGLAARHDSLRTTFAEQNGDVVQTVHERADLPYAYDDVSDLGADDRAAWVRAALQAETERPFDLSRLPLLDVRVVRLEPRRHLLLLRLPHIVSDGWTEGILVSDLAELYTAHRAGRAAALPALDIRYVDFATREKEWLASPALQAQKAYWLERFSGDTPAPKLPGDARPAGGERHAVAATTLVDDETIAALRGVAAAHGSTFFATLLSVFDVLLARLSGQPDIVVGTTVAGRGRPELERVAGVFANMLPLRASLAGNPRFSDVLRRVRETTLEAMARQDYPFQLWIDELRRRRANHDLRLFSAFFVVHEEAFSPSFDALTARWFSTDAFGNTFERRALQMDQWQQLMFAANDTGRGWRIAVLGDGSVFTDGALEHLLEQWIAIARQVSADPDRRLDEIELPARAEADPALAMSAVALDRDELDYLFA